MDDLCCTSARAQRVGAFTHALGVGIVLLALGWGAGVLRPQRRRIAGAVLVERQEPERH